jgi:hypothetical protein
MAIEKNSAILITPAVRCRRRSRPKCLSDFEIEWSCVKLSDLLAFAQRDWHALSEIKAAYWAEVGRSSGSAPALRAGEELRRQVRHLHPEWPSAREREQDLVTHARVAASLRRVARKHAR